MFTYTVKEIVSELYDHYRVDKKTGTVYQVMGWDNRGDNEYLREMVLEGLEIKLKALQDYADVAIFDLSKLTKTLFKTGSVKKAINDATEEVTRRMDRVNNLKVLMDRVQYATDIPAKSRKHFAQRSLMSDALLEEVRAYIRVNLLDDDKVFNLKTPLTRWYTATHTVYRVERDFTITEWRVGVAGYKNIITGGYFVGGLELTYYVHSFKTDQTLHQIEYDPETGNFGSSANYYCGGGKYELLSEVYFANIDDAVAEAEKGIKELAERQRNTIETARENLNKAA